MKKLSMKKLLSVILFCIMSFVLTSCSLLQPEIHGKDLLKLNDNQLYERVYLQNLDLVESYNDEQTALSQISEECRTVYILSIYDMEIQNGGLCQFFVNSSRSLAPYLNECFKAVNAIEHKELLSSFTSKNNIDLNNLESFKVDTTEEFIEQTKRYDFDAFDDSYCDITPLQDYIVSYIKANIDKF